LAIKRGIEERHWRFGLMVRMLRFVFYRG